MKSEWFVHGEFVVLLVVLIGGFYTLDGKIERQGNRTDRLYEIWCETQVEIKDLHREIMQENKEFHARVCILEEREKIRGCLK